jgi:general stress protein 26
MLNAESRFVHEVQDRLECIILIVKKRQTKEFVRQEGDGNVRKNQNLQRYDKRLVCY